MFKRFLCLILGLIFFIVLSAGLPNNGRAQTQPLISVSGTLETEVYDDFTNQRTWTEYSLRDTTGKNWHMEIPPDTQLAPKSGAYIRVTGNVSPDGKALNINQPQTIEILSNSINTQALPATGTKKIAVILFNFLDDARQTFTLESARQKVFTDTSSANAYYQEASFQQLNFIGKLRTDGDVFGWYHIPYNKSPCDTGNWILEAKTQATAAGVDLTGYDYFVYAFPGNIYCPWSGIASADGVIINGEPIPNTVTHEFGHRFGLYHASSLRCVDVNGQPVSISNNCTYSEYGDPFSIMGLPFTYTPLHHHNYHKEKLGWYTNTHIQTATTGGQYTLKPIEQLTEGIHVLKIPKDATHTYYLEYRQPYGFDTIGSDHPLVNGVSIRLDNYSYAAYTSSFLIDTSPASDSNFLDSPLALNNSFTDPDMGLRITATAIAPTEAQVRIERFTPTPPPTGQYFLTQVGEQYFRFYTTNTDTIRLATDAYLNKLPLFPNGKLLRNNEPYNFNWSWHFDPRDVTILQ